MLRFILAVITGYVVFGASTALWFQLTGHNPQAAPSLRFGIASILYGIVCAIIAGFVAAQLAPRGKPIAGALVGAIIATAAAASLILEGQQGSIRTQLSILLLIPPATYVGAILHRKMTSAPRA